MQKNNYSKDEINLGELFDTLWLQKKLIIVITVTITILTGIYVSNKSSTYEATALIKTGNYQNSQLQKLPELLRELNFLFVYDKSRTPYINSIFNRDFKAKTMFEIKAEALSKELAVDNIRQVVSYMQSNDVNNFNRILSMKNKKISLIDELINLIKNKHPKDDHQEIAVLNDKKLSLMVTDKNSLKTAKIVGKIIIRNKPTKSKKIRMIVVAFIIGFFLSIFLILIANTFKSKKIN
ncbi:MAG TPA: hypothetical protein EYQ06_04605 [Flavobacteriales bacterium]|jgi:LPS O-antigen subunit length determinant protein (WzzB/FepE family)|nr:hypothetical protein [Flavobacteriales bacterium]